MPVVPTYDGPKVLPTINTTPMGYKDFSGEIIRPKFNYDAGLLAKLQKEQDDAAIARAKDEIERYIADETYGVADENGVRKGGWLSIKGVDVLTPDADKRGLVERVDEGLQKKLQEVSGNLPASARKSFMESYGIPRSRQVYSQARSHVLAQDLQGRKGSYGGLIGTLISNAGSSVVNPQVFDDSLLQIEENTRKLAALEGWDENKTKAEINKNTSSAITNGIGYLLRESEQNPNFSAQALDVLNTYAKRMTFDDEVKSRHLVMAYRDKVSLGEAIDDAAAYFQSPTKFFDKANQLSIGQSGGYASMFFGGIIAQETGGKHYNDDGSIVVGRYADGSKPPPEKQAFGVAQVSQAAAKDVYKAKGWKWEADSWSKVQKDKAHNLNVGLSYYEGLVKQFDGNEEQAIVAYNQGAGTVKQAIAKAQTQEAKKEGKTWFDFLTPTAKNYLAGAKAGYDKWCKAQPAGKDGKAISIYDPEYFQQYKPYATRQEVEKYILERNPRASVDRDYLEQAVNGAMQKLEYAKRDDARRQQNGIYAITNWLYQNAGRIDQLPVELKQQVTVGAFEQLNALAKKIQAGDDSGDYYLWSKYRDNPEWLAAVTRENIEGLLMQFPPEYRKQARDLWSKQANAKSEFPDTKARAVRDADAGVYHDEFRPKREVLRQKLMKVVGEDNWKKAGKDWQAYLIDDASHLITDAAQRKYQAYSEEEIEAAVNEMMTTRFDRIGTDLTKIRTVSDLPNYNNNDLRRLSTAMAQARVNKAGLNRPPTDGEVLSVLRDLLCKKYPDIDGVDMASLRRSDNPRVRHILDTYRKNTGVEPDDIELLKLYAKSLLNGDEILEATDEQAQRAAKAIGNDYQGDM